MKNKIPELIIDNNNFDNFKSFVLSADFSEAVGADDYYCLIYKRFIVI